MMQIKRFPVATASIIALNAVIFAIGLLSGSQTQIIQNYGFIPNHLFYASNANDDGNNNNSADSAQQNPLSSLPPMPTLEPATTGGPPVGSVTQPSVSGVRPALAPLPAVAPARKGVVKTRSSR